jgi:eukaryotic-like serine/threonine-protein kinase
LRAVHSEAAAQSEDPVFIPDHELLCCIGRGAYGEVWLARSVLGAERAVKIVGRERFEHPRPFLREFEGIREFEPISRQHDGVVDILQVGRQEAWFYYVMELADAISDGGSTYKPRTLHAELSRRKRLPVAEVATLGGKLADALAFLHRHRLVHRDLKPSNILFAGGEPKLADVGLVAPIGGDRSFVGTEGYIAPEGPGTPAADIFALGLVLYEAATGMTRHDFPQLPPDLAASDEAEDFAELNAILLRACASRSTDRYSSAEVLRQDLRALADGRSIRRQRELERRLRRLTRAGVMAACTALLAAGGWWWQQKVAAEARADAAREAIQVAALAAKERELRVNLYAADMNQAGVATRAGNFGRARELLRAWIPGPGQNDLRDSAWHFLAEAANGDAHRAFRGHTRTVSGLVFSEDGGALFSSGFDGTLRQWDVTSGEGRLLAENRGEPLYDLDRLPGGDLIAPGGKATWRWRASEGQWQRLGDGAGRHAAVNAAAGWVAVGGKTQFFGPDDPVEILALDGSGLLRTLMERSGRVAVSAHGRWLATGDVEGKCVVYDTRDWSRIKEMEAPGQVVALAFSPDDRWLAGALREGGIALWDVSAGRLAFREEGHRRQVVWCLAFSPDSRWLASGGSDQTVHLWNVATRRLEQVMRGHEDEVWGLAFAPDNRSLASSSKDESIRLWPLADAVSEPRMEKLAGRVVFSPDCLWLSCAQKDGVVQIFDATTLQAVSELPVQEVPLAFAEDSRVLITSPRGRQLNHWDWRTGRVERSVPLAQAGANGDRIALSADGRWLAMGLTDGLLAIWSAQTGELVYRSSESDAAIYELAFSPDGRWLATSENDFTIRVRSTDDWTARHEFTHHKMRAAGLAFSPDSRLLVTASWDGSASVCQISDGTVQATFRGHTTSLQDVVFLPGGKLLAFLESDSSVAFWDLRSGRASARLPASLEESNHNLSLSPDGRTLISTRLSGGRPGLWRASVEILGEAR